jgi:hypothetical protein
MRLAAAIAKLPSLDEAEIRSASFFKVLRAGIGFGSLFFRARPLLTSMPTVR